MTQKAEAGGKSLPAFVVTRLGCMHRLWQMALDPSEWDLTKEKTSAS
jgi:hypothetical protein